MPTATFILGLCGSGKSCLAKQIQKESGAKVLDEGFIVTPRMQQELVEELRNGRDCIVVEITLCREDVRQEFIPWLLRHVPEAQIKWICFRNDLEKANANAWRRPDRDPAGHIAINHWVAQNYTYPPGAEVIDVYEDKAGSETSPPAK